MDSQSSSSYPSYWTVDVKDVNGTSLTLTADYALFYKEQIVTGGGGSRYTWTNTPSGNVAADYCPWLDSSISTGNSTAFNTFTYAQGLANGGTGNGCYAAGSGSQPAGKILQNTGYSGVQSGKAVSYYFAIGVAEGKNVGSVIINTST